MPVVEVRYIGYIAELSGCTCETVLLEQGSRLADLLARLASKYGPGFRKVVLDPATGEIGRFLFVLLNGDWARDAGTRLQDHDVIVLSPMLSGG